MSGEFKNGVPIRANRKTINLINKLDTTQTLMLNESIRTANLHPNICADPKAKTAHQGYQTSPKIIYSECCDNVRLDVFDFLKRPRIPDWEILRIIYFKPRISNLQTRQLIQDSQRGR